jgi:hypothetical protein
VQQLTQLSSLVNLEQLHVYCLPWPTGGLPGGLPSQLVKLTSIGLLCEDGYTLGHFQHLSRYTALQELRVYADFLQEDHLPGIGHLSQLTSLELKCNELFFSAAGTRAGTQLTALQRLFLSGCTLQPEFLAACTQLQDLELEYWEPLDDVSFMAELAAVTKLTLLTKLSIAE